MIARLRPPGTTGLSVACNDALTSDRFLFGDGGNRDVGYRLAISRATESA